MCNSKIAFPVVKAPSGAPEVTAEGLPIKRWRKIRGFDEAADLDQDGYLTGKEYRNRLNKDATARFVGKAESFRLVECGHRGRLGL